MRGTYWLMVIIVVSWFLILVESYVFFAIIRPLGPPIHVGLIPSTIAKIAGTAALALVWFAVMLSLSALYTRSRERPTARTPS